MVPTDKRLPAEDPAAGEVYCWLVNELELSVFRGVDEIGLGIHPTRSAPRRRDNRLLEPHPFTIHSGSRSTAWTQLSLVPPRDGFCLSPRIPSGRGQVTCFAITTAARVVLEMTRTPERPVRGSVDIGADGPSLDLGGMAGHLVSTAARSRVTLSRVPLLTLSGTNGASFSGRVPSRVRRIVGRNPRAPSSIGRAADF